LTAKREYIQDRPKASPFSVETNELTGLNRTHEELQEDETPTRDET
jgi:hypothetical protein